MSRFIFPLTVIASLAGIFFIQNHALSNMKTDLATANEALIKCQLSKSTIEANAAACTRSVEEAEAVAVKRAADAQAAVAAAQEKANKASERVAELLKQRPSNPDNLCQSADVLLTTWIKGRAKP